MTTTITRLLSIITLALATGTDCEAARDELQREQLRTGDGFCPADLTVCFDWSESNEIEDGWSGSMADAEELLGHALHHVGRAYDKTHFTITTPCGSTYSGRLDLCASDYSVVGHVDRVCTNHLAVREGSPFGTRRDLTWWLEIMKRAELPRVGDVIGGANTVEGDVFNATRTLRGKIKALEPIAILAIGGKQVQGRGRNRSIVVRGPLPVITSTLVGLALEGTIRQIIDGIYTVAVNTSRKIGTMIV